MNPQPSPAISRSSPRGIYQVIPNPGTSIRLRWDRRLVRGVGTLFHSTNRILRSGLLLLSLMLIAGRSNPDARAQSSEFASPSKTLVISAIFADGFAGQDADEAIQIWNLAPESIDLEGLSISDGRGRASFPAGARIEAGQYLWLTAKPHAFERSFGHAADWAWASDSTAHPTTSAMEIVNSGLRLNNGGDRIELLDARSESIDRVYYGTSKADADPHWQGESVQVFAPIGIRRSGQILYRKLRRLAVEMDQTSMVPSDTNSAADWASDPQDLLWGRRARLPGWDLESQLHAQRFDEFARLRIAISPDASYAFLSTAFKDIEESIDLMVYTFENPGLAEILAEKAEQGRKVRILVEGRPVGGIDMAQRYCLDLIAKAGGQVYWLDTADGRPPRYRSQHAKLGVIDGTWTLISSENPNLGSSPADDPSDGTAGRRGVNLLTDSPSVHAWAQALIERDLDPAGHIDLRPFQARDPQRGAPEPGFEPERAGGGNAYRPIAEQIFDQVGRMTFEPISAPETALDPHVGVPGLVSRAGPGDEVWVQQLSEPLWWGGGPEEGAIALNPRLRSYLDAARRGAKVRILLDGYFADPDNWKGNHASMYWLNAQARAHGLDLEARLGNPSGKGIHNKMILLSSGCRGETSRLAPACRDYWSHIGSINGSEVASKVNREAAINIRSQAVYNYLVRIAAWDWDQSAPQTIYLPTINRSTGQNEPWGEDPGEGPAVLPQTPTLPRMRAGP